MKNSQEKTNANLFTTERQKKKEKKLFRTVLLLNILFLSVEICVGFIYLPQENDSPLTTEFPTTSPTKEPTTNPSLSPTSNPSLSPTTNPSLSPTTKPSLSPTKNPSLSPTFLPSSSPTQFPTSEFFLSTNELEKLCDLCHCVTYFYFDQNTNTYSGFDIARYEIFTGFSTELLRHALDIQVCCGSVKVPRVNTCEDSHHFEYCCSD